MRKDCLTWFGVWFSGMGEKVSKLFPRGSFRDPDGVLEYSKGELKSVLVLGEMRDGRQKNKNTECQKWCKS